AQIAARRRTPPALCAAGAGGALGAPIENITAPPTGWPSAEITRKLSTWVPRRSAAGAGIVTVSFSAARAGSAMPSPSGPISRSASGDTGSLKRSRSAAGAAGTTAPSAGSAFTSEAWARASPTCATSSSSSASAATTNAAGRAATSQLRQELQCRRRLGIAARRLARGGNLDPAVHALLAFLHHREVQHLAGFEIAGDEAREHELVVTGVGQVAAAELHLGHPFGEPGAVKVIVGLGVFAAHRLDLPAGLRHRLDRDHPLGNAHAQRHRGGAVAAARPAPHPLVGR